MKNSERGNGFIGLVIIIGLIWFAISLFTEKDNSNVDSHSGSSYNGYYDDYDYEDYEDYAPENPYDDGSGHSAGFEWAEENEVDSCGGNSNSFVEGCEEYFEQRDNQDSYEEEYDDEYYDRY